jgi:hypothetical protein
LCASLALLEGNILAIVGFKGTTLYHSSSASWSLKWKTFSVVAPVGRSWVKRSVGHNFNFGRHREGKVDRAKCEDKKSNCVVFLLGCRK